MFCPVNIDTSRRLRWWRLAIGTVLCLIGLSAIGYDASQTWREPQSRRIFPGETLTIYSYSHAGKLAVGVIYGFPLANATSGEALMWLDGMTRFPIGSGKEAIVYGVGEFGYASILWEGFRHVAVVLPHWLLSVVFSLLLYLFGRRLYITKRAMRWKFRGCCSQCGYDLRGSRSNACPECGGSTHFTEPSAN